jgi:hypothetical protein
MSRHTFGRCNKAPSQSAPLSMNTTTRFVESNISLSVGHTSGFEEEHKLYPQDLPGLVGIHEEVSVKGVLSNFRKWAATRQPV